MTVKRIALRVWKPEPRREVRAMMRMRRWERIMMARKERMAVRPTPRREMMWKILERTEMKLVMLLRSASAMGMRVRAGMEMLVVRMVKEEGIVVSEESVRPIVTLF